MIQFIISLQRSKTDFLMFLASSSRLHKNFYFVLLIKPFFFFLKKTLSNSFFFTEIFGKASVNGNLAPKGVALNPWATPPSNNNNTAPSFFQPAKPNPTNPFL